MAVSLEQAFISVGCNQTPQAADCSPTSGRIALGARCTVALWNPVRAPQDPGFHVRADGQDATGRGISVTLRAHAGDVNAVKWIPSRGTCEAIVSGSVDKTVRIWEEHDDNVPPPPVSFSRCGNCRDFALEGLRC
jgi:WD40 repeat protein